MQYLRTTRWLLVGTAIALAVTGCEAEQPPEAAPAVPQVFAESSVQEDPEQYPETQNDYGELTYSEWADNQALEWQLPGDGFAGID